MEIEKEIGKRNESAKIEKEVSLYVNLGKKIESFISLQFLKFL